MRKKLGLVAVTGLLVTAACVSSSARPRYRSLTAENLPSAVTRMYLEGRGGLASTASATVIVPALADVAPLLSKAVPIDLATVLSLAGEKPNVIRLAKERARARDAMVDQAFADLLPTVNLNAPNYEYHHGWQQFGRFKIRRGPPGPSGGNVGLSTLNYTSQRFYVGIWSMLIDKNYFEATNLVLQRQHERNAANYATEQTIVETIALAAELYFDLAVAQCELESSRGLLALAREAELLQRNRVRREVAIELEHEETETELATAVGAVAEKEAQFINASTKLATLLRLDPTILLFIPEEDLIRPLTFVSAEASVESLINAALENRPDLAAALEEVEAAESASTAATYGPFFPWIRAGFFGRDGGIGIEASSGNRTMHGRQDYLVAVEWHLEGLGLGQVAKYRLADANLAAAKVVRDNTRERIMQEVVSLHQMIKQQTVHIEFALRRYKGTRDNIHVSEERHEQGTVPYAVVRKAKQVHAAATRDVAFMVGVYNRLQYKLLAALGERPE